MCRIGDDDVSSSEGTSPRPWYARKRSLSLMGLMALVSSMQTVATSAFLTKSPTVSRPIFPTPNVDIFLSQRCPMVAPTPASKPIRSFKSFTSARYASSLLPAVSAIPTSWFYLFGLSLQFGLQPLLTQAFTPSGIIRSTVIMAQDLARFSICCLMLVIGGSWQIALQSWCLRGALIGAGIPSILYLVQNYFALIAYQALPPVTFNILNQTKTLSAALCCYLILGRRQSAMQIISLFLLLMSALVIEDLVPLPWTKEAKAAAEPVETTIATEAEYSDAKKKAGKLGAGVVPILIASFISGLAGAVSQRTLQSTSTRYNAYVFSMELSAFSMLIMATSLVLGSPDGRKLRSSGFSKGWTWKTWIPVFTNAAGGVLVGLVTQHSGAVRKGFALIFGLLLSAVLQNFVLSDEGITGEQVLGGALASCSVWMHSKFPPP